MYLSAKSEVKKSAGSLSLWERVRERVFHPLANRRPSPSPSQRAGGRRPRSLWERVFLLLLLLLLLPACRQSPPVDQAPDVQVLLTPGPDSLFVGPITFDLTLWDADGQPLDGASPVTLRGDMSHAGMKPVQAQATGDGDGLYTADFEWTMAGDWTVTIEATLPDGRLTIATFPFSVEELEELE